MNRTLWINDNFIIPIFWNGTYADCGISAKQIISTSKTQKPVILLHDRSNAVEQIIVISDISYQPNDGSVYGFYLTETGNYISVSIIDYDNETTVAINEGNISGSIAPDVRGYLSNAFFPVGTEIFSHNDINESLEGTWLKKNTYIDQDMSITINQNGLNLKITPLPNTHLLEFSVQGIFNREATAGWTDLVIDTDDICASYFDLSLRPDTNNYYNLPFEVLGSSTLAYIQRTYLNRHLAIRLFLNTGESITANTSMKFQWLERYHNSEVIENDLNTYKWLRTE